MSILSFNKESSSFKWLDLWRNRKKKSMMVAEAYQKSHKRLLMKKAMRMQECGNWLLFEGCKTLEDGHTKRLKAGDFCNDRLCAVCNKKRAMQLLSSLMLVLKPFLAGEYKIIFMTLTIRNVSELKRDVYKQLWKYWKKFQRNFLLGRKRNSKGEHYYDGPCIGGVVTLETTYNPGQEEGLIWHPHLHGLLICKEYLNHEKACKYWEKITGNSRIISFEKVEFDSERGILDGVIETVKYLAKLNDDMPGEKIVELALALRYVRCINGFGVLRGFVKEGKELKKEMEHSLVCSKCGSDLVSLLLKWYQNQYIVKTINQEEAEVMRQSCCNNTWQVAKGSEKKKFK